MEWDGIELKADLPYEYVSGDSPKFWYVPTATIDDTHYGEFIQLGRNSTCTFPRQLYAGTVITHHEHLMLKEYLSRAGARLSQIKEEVARSKRVVDRVEFMPAVSPV